MLCKKLILGAFLTLLIGGGCGWHPVYYQNKSSDQTLQTASVDVLPIPDESGRFLRSQLNDLLNPQKQEIPKEYTLQVDLSEQLYTDQGILGDNTSTRATMRLNAHLILRKNDIVLLDTTTFASSSYNILMLPYPTVTAEQATRHRLLDMLADQVAMRVTAYFKSIRENQ